MTPKALRHRRRNNSQILTMAQKHILLIDDDPILGDIMKRRLEEDGYRATWERDGEMGLSAMATLRPDLVLLDIIMPKVNGYEVLERMGKDPNISGIPVIVVSNSGQPVEIERILKLGVRDYIVKAHFSPEEVIQKVRGVVGEGEKGATSDLPKKAPGDTKILLIEDDPMLSEIAADRFRHDGYKVVLAHDGKEGLRIAGEEMPDLILLDIIMPGMSGFEVLRQLKEDEKLRVLPVIIFSNLAQDRDIAEGRRLGAVDFFIKANHTPAQVVEKVKSVLAHLESFQGKA